VTLQSRPRWLVPGYFFAAIVVYGAFVWQPIYWVDEYLTQSAINLPWGQLADRIATKDPAMGPFYLLLKTWSLASTNLVWMRLPSILAMAAAVAILVALVRRAANTRSAIFAGALMLLLPTTSRFAQELRPYALATCFAVAAVALWWQTLHSRRLWWPVGFGAAVLLMGLFHLYTLTLVPALLVATIAVPRQGRVRALWLTAIPAAAAGILIVPHVLLNLAHPTGSPTAGPLSFRAIIQTAESVMGGRWLFVSVAILALIGVGTTWQSPALRPAAILGLCWTVVPPVLLLVGKAAADLPILVPRYFVFCLPGACLLAALGLAWVFSRIKLVAIVVVIGLIALGLPRQLHIRAIDGHNTSYVLGPLLTSAPLATMPKVVANDPAIRLVNSTTYPLSLLTTTVANGTPYVVVIERLRFSKLVKPDFVYYNATGPWRPVLTCRVPDALVTIVKNTTAQPPPLDVGAVAAQLKSASGGVAKCTPVNS